MTLMLSVAADLLRQQNLQQLKQEKQEADPDAEPPEEFQLKDVLELMKSLLLQVNVIRLQKKCDNQQIQPI